MRRPALLILALLAFVGWLSWLGYTALTKSHAPTVSHAQAAAANYPVVAEVEAGREGSPGPAKVVEALTPAGPVAGTELDINLTGCQGYEGPGKYLLLLSRSGTGPYFVVAQQRSPGYDVAGGKPLIYPWSPDVEAQVRKLYP